MQNGVICRVLQQKSGIRRPLPQAESVPGAFWPTKKPGVAAGLLSVTRMR
jgi:hypothetical protein